MPTIILCTDFSETSYNALSYVCSLVSQSEYSERIRLLLLHIYEIPVTYSADGVAIASIDDGIARTEEQLNEEWNRLCTDFPRLNIIKKLGTGTLYNGLSQQLAEEQPSLVAIGAGGQYSDLISWDNEVLGIVRDLLVPVLVIPRHVPFTPIKRIAFSCNLAHVTNHTPFTLIKGLTKLTGASLHVLFVTTNSIEKSARTASGEQMVIHQLQEVKPEYHKIREEGVVEAVTQFVKTHAIDLLIVTPRRHGIWESLFQRDKAKALVRVNSLPILALREQ